MNILIGSTLGIPCTHITIQSTGESAYVRGGEIEQYIFGTYRFISTDARGNNIYHAHIQGIDRFITKNNDNRWVVNITLLSKFKSML